jgi:hypothetical protein
MNSRMTRLVRGSVAATFATFVALFSHVAGGGTLPSAAALSLSLAFALLVCMLISGRSASLWRSAVSIGLSQFVFHAVFSTMGVPSAPAAVSGDAAMLGMHSGMQQAGTLSASATASVVHSSPSMWIAHAVAAVITVAAFGLGERAWAGLGVTARGILAILIPAFCSSPIALPGAPNRVPLQLDVVALASRVFLSSLRYRGPPAALGN